MTKEEWAKLLNGREYRHEITRQETEQALFEDMVIIFGASDDLVEIVGVVNDELGCFEGGSFYFNDRGLVLNICDSPYCPHFIEAKNAASKVVAVWDQDGYSWTYETDIPHATFDIMEDGEKYCRGIVFSLADVR